MLSNDPINVQLRLELSMIQEIERYSSEDYGEFNRWMLRAVEDFLRRPQAENLTQPILYRLSEHTEKTRRNIRCLPDLLEDIDERVYQLNTEHKLEITRTQWLLAALRVGLETERKAATRRAVERADRKKKRERRRKRVQKRGRR